MAIDMTLIETLRAQGATKIAFHADGCLASVEFAHEAAPATDPQNTTPAAPKREKRSAGGLVFHAPDSD